MYLKYVSVIYKTENKVEWLLGHVNCSHSVLVSADKKIVSAKTVLKMIKVTEVDIKE